MGLHRVLRGARAVKSFLGDAGERWAGHRVFVSGLLCAIEWTCYSSSNWTVEQVHQADQAPLSIAITEDESIHVVFTETSPTTGEGGLLHTWKDGLGWHAPCQVADPS